MSLSAIPRTLRMAVLERDLGRCRYCGLRQLGQGALFHVDHILPKSKGGATTIDNLALQCPHCSLRKSSKTQCADPASGAPVGLFHPLADRWDDHFRLEVDGGITGLSATGRATIAALQMNAPIVRTARAMQVQLGLT